jgi:hypothetical protein
MWWKVVDCILPLKLIHWTHSDEFLGVLNKDPIIWLDWAKHGNTSIPSSFPGNTLACSIPTTKHKKVAKFGEITLLYLKKSEKEFDNFTFGNSELVKCEIHQIQQTFHQKQISCHYFWRSLWYFLIFFPQAFFALGRVCYHQCYHTFVI